MDASSPPRLPEKQAASSVTDSGFRFTRKVRLTPQDDSAPTFGSDVSSSSSLPFKPSPDESNNTSKNSTEKEFTNSKEQKRQQQQPEVFEFDEVERLVGPACAATDVPTFPTLDVNKTVVDDANVDADEDQFEKDLKQLIDDARQKTKDTFIDKNEFISTTLGLILDDMSTYIEDQCSTARNKLDLGAGVGSVPNPKNANLLSMRSVLVDMVTRYERELSVWERVREAAAGSSGPSTDASSDPNTTDSITSAETTGSGGRECAESDEYDAAALALRINESVAKLTQSVAVQSERVQSKLLGVKRSMEQADVLKAHLAQKLNARSFKAYQGVGDPRAIIKKLTHAAAVGGHSNININDDRQSANEQELDPEAKKVCVIAAASTIVAVADKQMKTSNSNHVATVNAA